MYYLFTLGNPTATAYWTHQEACQDGKESGKVHRVWGSLPEEGEKDSDYAWRTYEGETCVPVYL